MENTERPIMTRKEFARYMGISDWQVTQMINKSDLPTIKLGKRVVIPKKQMTAWIDEQARKEA